MIYKLHIALLVYFIAAGSLILLSAALAAFRRFLGRNNPPFVYPIDVAAAEVKVAAEGYWHRALVAIDICMNVVFMKGNQGETMSTHAWRSSLKGHLWGRAMNLWLNGFQPQHGPQAASGDLERGAAEVALLKRLLGVQ